jgi:hypothetical protein
MTTLRNAKECHAHALMFTRHAATCASPEARQRYASIAKAWMEFAGRFVESSGRQAENARRKVRVIKESR